MSNKVLIISPTPTHPTTAGNRSRILNICDTLQASGLLIDFLYINFEKDADSVAMTNYFGNGYFELSHFSSNKLSLLNKCYNKFNSGYGKLLKHLNTEKYLDWKYNKFIDDYYLDDIDNFIKKNINVDSYSHVIVEYVVFSKAFRFFKNSTKKIIDTHDKLTDRYKTYLINEMKPEWYSLYRLQEKKGLNRADVIWAIQESEKKYFEKLCKKKVHVVGHQIIPKYIKSEYSNTILLIGSHNQLNIHGLTHFIEEILPIITNQIKDIKVIVAGNIVEKNKIIPFHPNVEFYGTYTSNEEVYKLSNIVIVPILGGSGLKIKTIDAMAYGKAVVSYSNGVEGLPIFNDVKGYYLLANSKQEFAHSVITLLNDKYLLNNTQDNAFNYASIYAKRNRANNFLS